VTDLAPVILVREAAAPVVEVDRPANQKLSILGWLAIAWVVTITTCAALAPWLPIASPNAQVVPDIGTGATLAHPLGVDDIGQDLLSRVIWGARASLTVAVASVAFGLIAGGTLGMIGGYFRGKLDTLLSYMFNVALAVPQLVLALAIVAEFAGAPATSVGQREFWLIISIGVVSIPIIGRLTRGATLSWSQREYVLAARSLGARNRRVVFREILPNVAPAMFSVALLGVSAVIVLEGGLSILGAGIPPSEPSWGNMIAISRNELTKVVGANPATILAPAAAIFFTVLALNHLGDVVRARFDARDSAL
jgi:peptide/nickel transport system permease protein